MPESSASGTVLVDLARAAIACEWDAGEAPRTDAPGLREPAATFVTLHRQGRLRGCIGTLDPHRPLGEDIVHNARAAAFRDPRFAPLARDEFPDLEVEVSLLSARVPMPAATESEAVAAIRPGLDGLVLEYGSARATFLPQVWESIPDPLGFLVELRRKAGLPERFWHPELRLSRYTVTKHVDARARA